MISACGKQAPGLKRRLVCGLVAASVWLAGATGSAADEFDTLRIQWRDMLTGGTNLNLADPLVQSRLSSIASSANSSWSSMNTSAGRTYLWADAARTNQSEDITTTYNRLRGMALAWATRGCSLQSNAALATAILSGLDWTYTNRYNETKTKYDNWWDWEIGSPQHLNNAAVLLYDILSPTQLANYARAIDKFVPTTTYTGANRTDTALVVAIRGILGRNAVKVANARDGLSPVFPYVSSGDGFYTDGSFIQHGKHPYTGSYGSVLMDGISRLMWLLAGSSWEVTDPAHANVYRWVYDSYEPVIYKGATLDNLRGRSISRVGSSDHGAGAGNMNSILQIAQFAPAADALAFKRMLKYWIQADTFRNYTNNVPLHLMAQTRDLMADTNVTPRGELLGHFGFPSMDRIVHLRPGFGFAISMSSSRVYTYESINNENLHGWFTGDGMTTLYNDDLGQFSGNFWATVDPYHLPGTTVDLTARVDGSGQSATTGQEWVGGAVLAGEYGVAGMSLDAQLSTLTGRKSWFMFDNEIVCLGAGVTCGGSNPVHTTVENRRLSSSATNQFVAGGVPMPATAGWQSNFTALTWCSLGGAGGYYFPGGATISAFRERRTNTWYEINKPSTLSASLTNPVSDTYLKLWFNHGVRPTNSTYAYALLPNLASAQVAAYSSSPQFVVLQNTPAIQAVRETNLGIEAANFWNAGTSTAGAITVNNKSAMMLRETGSLVEAVVSDPTQTNTGAITVTINRAAYWLVTADAGITVQQLSPQIRFSVSVSGARGKSFRASFSTDPANPNPTWDANPLVTGAQDGSGVWSNTSSNWWNNVTNVSWNDAAAPIATFGNGGSAGTVTVGSARTVGALVFKPVGSGVYTLAGPGPLQLRNGITAESPVQLATPLELSSDQAWTVTAGKTLTASGPITASSPLSLSLNGAGTIQFNGGAQQLPSNLGRVHLGGSVLVDIATGAQVVPELTLENNVAPQIRGGGSLTIAGASPLRIGGTVSGANQVLDLSRLAAFTNNAASKAFSVGGQTSSVQGNGAIWLATNSAITAQSFSVQSVTGSTATQSTGMVYLGRTTVINADSGNVGLVRDYGTVQFQPGTVNPTLRIRGSDGVSAAGTWKIGGRSSSYFAVNTGLVDLVAGVSGSSELDARLGTLILADEGYCLTTTRQVNGIWVMGGGTLDVNHLLLASKSSVSTQSLGVVNAAFYQTNGGVVVARTLTLADAAPGNTGTMTAGYYLGGGGTLAVEWLQSGAGAATRSLFWNDGTIRNYPGAAELIIQPNLTLTGNGTRRLEIDAGCTGTIHSAIAGPGGLIKAGAGTVVLTSSNGFAGPLVVSAGTLVLNGAGGLSNCPQISLEVGTRYDVAGVNSGYRVGPSQLLEGVGTVRGHTTVAGRLAPGNPIGTMVFENDLVLAGRTDMDIHLTAEDLSHDRVLVQGPLVLGGLLQVNFSGTNALRAGDTFRLFEAPGYSGSFAPVNLPSLTAPLYWTNRLALDGTVAVASPVNMTPASISFDWQEGVLRLSWPADRTGWRLLGQTNSGGLTTQWWPVVGSERTNAISITPDRNQGSVYFRLVYP